MYSRFRRRQSRVQPRRRYCQLSWRHLTSSSANRLNVTLTGFSPTLGATRTEVEELFHYIDKRTIFKVASKIKGVPRTLGQDKGLYTAVESMAIRKFVDVQVVSILVLQVRQFSRAKWRSTHDVSRILSKAAQKWCMVAYSTRMRMGLSRPPIRKRSMDFDHRSNVPLFGEFERSGRLDRRQRHLEREPSFSCQCMTLG